jgi:SAM-dependent methyltransferase
MSNDRDDAEKWAEYFARTQTNEPRKTCIMALDRFEAEGFNRGRAVDLGCGGGRDTIEILKRGWSVLAIDRQQVAIDHLLSRPDLPEDADLQTRVANFEAASWGSVDLVNSSFALPLCPQDAFPEFWQRLVASLKPGGRFSGHLYGEKDDWVDDPTVSHFTRPQVLELLEPFDIEYFEEEEDDSTSRSGAEKHWHVFHIVARLKTAA